MLYNLLYSKLHLSSHINNIGYRCVPHSLVLSCDLCGVLGLLIMWWCFWSRFMSFFHQKVYVWCLFVWITRWTIKTNRKSPLHSSRWANFNNYIDCEETKWRNPHYFKNVFFCVTFLYYHIPHLLLIFKKFHRYYFPLSEQKLILKIKS